ncbi:MAG: helix-turn-helix domain-containing protein [Aequorivita sp.]
MKKNKRNSITDWLDTKGDALTRRMVENNFYYIDRINYYMEDHGITSISELARILNKKQPQVYRWMSGEQNITSETLAYIELKLDIRLVDQGKEQKSNAQPIILSFTRNNASKKSNSDYQENNTISYAAGTC